jgi:uncharacterized CHY-type Zn-finger protein
MRKIYGESVLGRLVDGQTRCAHYNSPFDIVAIKFKCCGQWYPCFECHKEAADHDAKVWLIEELGEKAILCGACGHQLSIDEYLECQNACPKCETGFNPGCANHYDLYFERRLL